MPKFGDFLVWISVEGVELEQYQTEVSADGKTITCYIASEEGKKFAIHWKNFGSNASKGSLKLDGLLCKNKILMPFPLRKRDTCSMSYVRATNTSKREFMFSRIELTDDPLFSEARNEMGSIELEIRRVLLIDEVHGRNERVKKLKLDTAPVHERFMKAGSHQVRYSPPSDVTRRRRTYNCKSLSIGPEAVFVFKYRPLDRLIADGIVEPEKRATLTLGTGAEITVNMIDNSVDVLDAEIRALEDKLAALVASRTRVAKQSMVVKVEPTTHEVLFYSGRTH